MTQAGQVMRAADLQSALGGSHASHESLQQACLDLLRLRKVPAVPIHTGPRVRPRAGGGWELRANRKQRGFADVAACLPPAGLLLLIECKTGGARRSNDQKRHAEEFARAGALAVVIRDVKELEALLDRYAPRHRQGGRP